MNENKEKQLVVLLQETGAPNVADLLFKPYVPRVKKFLLSRGACQSDVDDLVQETLLTGFLKINQFREESTFSTWLMRIAFRKFIDTKRKASRLQRLLEKFSLNRSDSPVMIDHSFYFERYERVLEDLSKEQQNVFLCCDWLGMSHTETSKTLGLALGSVKSYLKQARALLGLRVGDTG